jgi:hypothetical protein
MDMNKAFPGEYLKGHDVEDQPVKIISAIYYEGISDTVHMKKAGDDVKPILHFQDETQLVLNQVNTQTLTAVLGVDSQKWDGKKIKLYFDPNVMFGGKRTGGIRIKMPKLPEATPQPPADFDDDIPF